jgi:RNA polymerase sigma-70 factor (ECF subfamily)
MESTSASLLNRLRQPRADVAWQRFVDLYAPLIFHWGRQKGLASTDAADLVQDVLADLVVELRTFRYDPSRRFRGWLHTVVVNRASNLRRRLELAPQSVDATDLNRFTKEDESDLFAESEYRCRVALRAFELLKTDFETTTWQAAWLQIIEGQKAAEVAASLGMTLNAVYVAKSRVLTRLRQEMDGLLE